MLIYNMSGDTYGGVCLKENYTYYTYDKVFSGNTCYDVTGHVNEDIITGMYVLPYKNNNANFTINIYNTSLVLNISGTTINNWVDEYINSLVTSGYTGYNGASQENRVIYEPVLNIFYKIEYSKNINRCSVDEIPRYAIFDEINGVLWDGSGNYYYSELDDCNLETGRLFISLIDINKNSNTYLNKKYVEKCKVNKPKLVLTITNITGITNNSSIITTYAEVVGATSIVERGVCYSTFSGPTIDDIVKQYGMGPGISTITLSGLRNETIYYIKAYGISSSGDIFYGDEIIFKTLT